jgi:hypothetical protein
VWLERRERPARGVGLLACSLCSLLLVILPGARARWASLAAKLPPQAAAGA